MLNTVVTGISIPACFSSLMMVLISAVPTGIQYCFWFAILVESLSTTMAHINMFTPIIYSGTGERSTGCMCGPTGPTLS